MKAKTLLNQCLIKMAKAGYLQRGGKKLLAAKLKLNYHMMIYALSGARTGKTYIGILNKINKLL